MGDDAEITERGEFACEGGEAAVEPTLYSDLTEGVDEDGVHAEDGEWLADPGHVEPLDDGVKRAEHEQHEATAEQHP